jgi:betaine-aldehyde dehydrogenase
LPEGVFNLVVGDGVNVGEEMNKNTSIDMVSFASGIETGKGIMRNAADNVKKVTLEPGSKNPHIIFKDADFETALDFICNGVFFQCGQICSAGSRALIEQDIYDEFFFELIFILIITSIKK